MTLVVSLNKQALKISLDKSLARPAELEGSYDEYMSTLGQHLIKHQIHAEEWADVAKALAKSQNEQEIVARLTALTKSAVLRFATMNNHLNIEDQLTLEIINNIKQKKEITNLKWAELLEKLGDSATDAVIPLHCLVEFNAFKALSNRLEEKLQEQANKDLSEIRNSLVKAIIDEIREFYTQDKRSGNNIPIEELQVKNFIKNIAENNHVDLSLWRKINDAFNKKADTNPQLLRYLFIFDQLINLPENGDIALSLRLNFQDFFKKFITKKQQALIYFNEGQHAMDVVRGVQYETGKPQTSEEDKKLIAELGLSNRMSNYIQQYVHLNGLLSSGFVYWRERLDVDLNIIGQHKSRHFIKRVDENTFLVITKSVYYSCADKVTSQDFKAKKVDDPVIAAFQVVEVKDSQPLKGDPQVFSSVAVTVLDNRLEAYNEELNEKIHTDSLKNAVDKYSRGKPLFLFERNAVKRVQEKFIDKNFNHASSDELFVLAMNDATIAKTVLEHEDNYPSLFEYDKLAALEKKYPEILKKFGLNGSIRLDERQSIRLTEIARPLAKLERFQRENNKAEARIIVKEFHKLPPEKNPHFFEGFKWFANDKGVDVVLSLLQGRYGTDVAIHLTPAQLTDLAVKTWLPGKIDNVMPEIEHLKQVEKEIATALLQPSCHSFFAYWHHPSHRLSQEQLITISQRYPELWVGKEQPFGCSKRSTRWFGRMGAFLFGGRALREDVSGESLVKIVFDENHPEARVNVIMALESDKHLAKKFFNTKAFLNQPSETLNKFYHDCNSEVVRRRLLNIKGIADKLWKVRLQAKIENQDADQLINAIVQDIKPLDADFSNKDPQQITNIYFEVIAGRLQEPEMAHAFIVAWNAPENEKFREQIAAKPLFVKLVVQKAKQQIQGSYHPAGLFAAVRDAESRVELYKIPVLRTEIGLQSIALTAQHLAEYANLFVTETLARIEQYEKNSNQDLTYAAAHPHSLIENKEFRDGIIANGSISDLKNILIAQQRLINKMAKSDINVEKQQSPSPSFARRFGSSMEGLLGKEKENKALLFKQPLFLKRLLVECSPDQLLELYLTIPEIQKEIDKRPALRKTVFMQASADQLREMIKLSSQPKQVVSYLRELFIVNFRVRENVKKDVELASKLAFSFGAETKEEAKNIEAETKVFEPETREERQLAQWVNQVVTGKSNKNTSMRNVDLELPLLEEPLLRSLLSMSFKNIQAISQQVTFEQINAFSLPIYWMILLNANKHFANRVLQSPKCSPELANQAVQTLSVREELIYAVSNPLARAAIIQQGLLEQVLAASSEDQLAVWYLNEGIARKEIEDNNKLRKKMLTADFGLLMKVYEASQHVQLKNEFANILQQSDHFFAETNLNNIICFLAKADAPMQKSVMDGLRARYETHELIRRELYYYPEILAKMFITADSSSEFRQTVKQDKNIYDKTKFQDAVIATANRIQQRAIVVEELDIVEGKHVLKDLGKKILANWKFLLADLNTDTVNFLWTQKIILKLLLEQQGNDIAEYLIEKGFKGLNPDQTQFVFNVFEWLKQQKVADQAEGGYNVTLDRFQNIYQLDKLALDNREDRPPPALK